MLMSFYCFNKICRIHKTLMCTCIQPGKSLSQKLHIQSSVFQIDTVQVCNLQFTTRRWFQIFRKLNNTIIIEIQSCYTVITLRFFRFFFNRNSLAGIVKFYNSKTFRIIHIITKYSRTFTSFSILYCSFQTLFQSMSGKNVITKNHRNCIITDEIRSNDKCLCQSVR